MDTKIKHFDAASPEELREALAGFKNGEARFAGVRVFGPKALTRQFNFPLSSTQDLIAGLKQEASETLSVPAAEIEVSYQITVRDEQGVHGIFLAIPRALLAEYLECFKNHPLIPVSLATLPLGGIIDFLTDHPLPGDNFCLVNFLKPDAVSIITFANARPTFFRELYDLSDSDFKDKITDTIRYSCRHSAIKSINQIFFIGVLEGKADLIKNLKELENPVSDQPASVNGGRVDFEALNLWENFVCSVKERTELVRIFSLIATVFILSSAFLAWHFVKGYSKLHGPKSRVSMSDYNQALDLQEQLRRLHHD